MQVRNFSLVIFMILSNMVICSLVCFSTFVNNLLNNAYIGLLIYIIPIILISLLFKGFKKGFNPLINIKKNKLIKNVISLYFIVSSSFMIYLTSIIIKDHFYNSLPIFTIFLVITFTVVFMSKNTPSRIISLSTLLFVILLLVNIIPFFHFKERNINLLLPININKNIFKCWIIFLFPLENIILAINSSSYVNGFSRKIFVLGNFLTLIYLLYIFVDSLSLLSANYYKNTIFSSFIRWSVYQGNKLFENYEVLLLIIMIITIIFRVSYNLSTLRIVNSFKINKFSGPLLSLLLLSILYLLYSFVNYFNQILIICLITCLVLIIIFYIYIIYLSYSTNNKNIKGLDYE